MKIYVYGRDTQHVVRVCRTCKNEWFDETKDVIEAELPNGEKIKVLKGGLNSSVPNAGFLSYKKANEFKGACEITVVSRVVSRHTFVSA